MKLDSEETLQMQLANPPAPNWRWAGALILALIGWLMLWYGESAASIVSIWDRSETFAHGFLVPPIAAYLIWTRRKEIAGLVPVPDWRGHVAVVGLGLIWLVARLSGVLVVEQYAFVGLIPAFVLAVLGGSVLWAMAFPLAFLLLGVPNGEALIPPMMEFTADFTVGLLQLTGIPVFREGLFFTIPSGNWSVVEGCSGLRYLIASITGGCLFAYLNYRSVKRRLLFIAASAIIPVIANGFRAYIIVMISHLSDAKLAHGVDHFIYGWVFFGIVMFVLFWVGSYWREPTEAPRRNVGVAPKEIAPSSPGKLLAVSVAAVTLAGVWPLYGSHIISKAFSARAVALESPQGAAGWTAAPLEITNWRPRYIGADKSYFQVYKKAGKSVALYIAYYRRQQQDAELINSQNIMVVQKHPVWSNVGEEAREDRVGERRQILRESHLRSNTQRLLVWDWFHVDDRRFVDPLYGKLLLAGRRILGNSGEGAAIIVAVPYQEDPVLGREMLREFLKDMSPLIDESLDKARAG